MSESKLRAVDGDTQIPQKLKPNQPGMVWLMPMRLRQEDCCKFKTRLDRGVTPSQKSKTRAESHRITEHTCSVSDDKT